MKDTIVDHSPKACERIRGFLSRVGDTWSFLIILALDGAGVMRFNELKRYLGISQRMLSRTLRELEKDGLIKRTAHDTVPPRVDYELTSLGQSFSEPIRVMGRWALDHLPEIDTARARFIAANGE